MLLIYYYVLYNNHKYIIIVGPNIVSSKILHITNTPPLNYPTPSYCVTCCYDYAMRRAVLYCCVRLTVYGYIRKRTLSRGLN